MLCAPCSTPSAPRSVGTSLPLLRSSFSATKSRFSAWHGCRACRGTSGRHTNAPERVRGSRITISNPSSRTAPAPARRIGTNISRYSTPRPRLLILQYTVWISMTATCGSGRLTPLAMMIARLPVRISRCGENRVGFLMVAPVYRPGAPHQTVPERREHLIGFVQAFFEISVLLESIINTTTGVPGLDVYFFPPGAADTVPSGALHFDGTREQMVPIGSETQRSLAASQRWSGPLTVGDAQWTMVAVPIAGGPVAPSYVRAWIVLICGILLTGAIAAYIWRTGKHAERLRTSNQELDLTLGMLSTRTFVSIPLSTTSCRASSCSMLPSASSSATIVSLRCTSYRPSLLSRAVRFATCYALAPRLDFSGRIQRSFAISFCPSWGRATSSRASSQRPTDATYLLSISPCLEAAGRQRMRT